jgi:hypothetical protein
MAKSQKEQDLYNKMLIIQVINYRKLGYTDIKVNNENYSHGQPQEIRGYRPDISAVWDDQTTLCEIVTHESLNETGVIEKWQTLSRYSDNFHMIIPQKSFRMIKDLMKSNGIFVAKYWHSKSCQ